MNDIDGPKLGGQRPHCFQVGGGKLPPLNPPVSASLARGFRTLTIWLPGIVKKNDNTFENCLIFCVQIHAVYSRLLDGFVYAECNTYLNTYI